MENFWYYPKLTLSHNCLLNYVVGARGVGKTYGSLKEGIQRKEKGKGNMIYLRRYKTEFADFHKQFATLSNDPDLNDFLIGVKGKKGYMIKRTDDELADEKNLYKEKNVFCYAIPLSTATSKKSTDFNDVSLIIFDEFIIEGKVLHYLYNEVEMLLSFIETVARMRSNIKILCMANAVTWNNPHFMFWNIKAQTEEFRKYKDKEGDNIICVHNVESKLYSEAKKKTAVGKLMSMTEYGRYTIDNEFINDDSPFIEKKTEKAIHICSLIINKKEVGVWIDYEADKLYLSKKVSKNNNVVYTLTREDRQPNILFLQTHKQNYHFKLLRMAYQNSRMFFENQEVMFICSEINKYLLI